MFIGSYFTAGYFAPRFWERSAAAVSGSYFARRYWP